MAALDQRTLVDDLVLKEIEGKNQAIHSYDDIIWKIRTGYLALFFVGWSSLAKGMPDAGQIQDDPFRAIVAATFAFTLMLALAGWYIDRTYVQRKHRVINALDKLTQEIKDANGDSERIPVDLLRVAGDDPERKYESKGYCDAARNCRIVYLAPLLLLLLVLIGFFLTFR